MAAFLRLLAVLKLVVFETVQAVFIKGRAAQPPFFVLLSDTLMPDWLWAYAVSDGDGVEEAALENLFNEEHRGTSCLWKWWEFDRFNCSPSKWLIFEPDIEVSFSFCFYFSILGWLHLFFFFFFTQVQTPVTLCSGELWSILVLCKKNLKHFWVIFTSLSSSTKKQDGHPSQFFCRTFKQFQTSKTQ